MGSTVFWLIGGNIGGLLAAVMVLGWTFWAKNHSALESHVQAKKSLTWRGNTVNSLNMLCDRSVEQPVAEFAGLVVCSLFFSGHSGIFWSCKCRRETANKSDWGVTQQGISPEGRRASVQDRNLRDSMIKTTLGLIGVGIVPLAY